MTDYLPSSNICIVTIPKEEGAGMHDLLPADHPERRVLKDRRLTPTNPVSISSLFGSRKHFRRLEDRDQPRYVDKYAYKYVFLYVVALLLSLTDAFLTLKLLDIGALEANPLMRMVLELGIGPFLLTKFILTVASLTALLICINFFLFGRWIPVKVVFAGATLLYCALITYEIALLL
jgi:hypothetical protein